MLTTCWGSTCTEQLVIANVLRMQIADHVLGQHMYRAAGEDGRSTKTDAQERCVAMCTQCTASALSVPLI